MEKNLRSKLWRLACCPFMITFMMACVSLRTAKADRPSKSANDSGNKAVRKGTMSIKGTPDQVREYREYVNYLSHDAAILVPGYTRPAISTFENVDSTSEPYTIGTQYNPSGKDRGDTSLTEMKFKWIAKYHVAASSGRSGDIRDIALNRPWGGAKVMWDSQNANRTSAEASVIPRTSTYTISLGPFGSFTPTLTPDAEDTGVVVSKEIFPSVQQQSPSYEPEPTEVRNFARIRVSAGVKGDAGWDGSLEVLASVKVYASPNTNVDAWQQWTVKEAFVYPNAIR